ncbi:hypothetical protein C8R44DRAFT_772426 [Mycena epipterygia]|nr:hypothetical protein C8R44DRAFT_772426 [Mycena epipterygia]
MSEDDLRTRLAVLSAAINRQNEGPSLQQIQSHIQSEPNNLLDPMANLPPELSSDIFLRCLPTAPEERTPNPHQAPMIFLNICHLWRTIALSTPALWTTLHIELPGAPGFEHLCDRWLARAGNRATSISMIGRLYPELGDVLTQRAHRVQNLELCFPSEKRLAQITGAFSALKTLTIVQDNDSSAQHFGRTARRVVQMMRAAPQLVECTFTEVYYKRDLEDDVGAAVIHPSLQRLQLGDGSSGSSATILQRLTLPALRSLHISDFDIPLNVALNFITRSAPPLQSLCMQPPYEGWPAEGIETFFRLLPDLTDLELRSREDDDFSFLEVLATVQNFLPNLRNLTINNCFPDRAGYHQILSVLSARRSQIQSFRLFWFMGRAGQKPDADIVAALQQFVADGMYIHVGTPRDKPMGTGATSLV